MFKLVKNSIKVLFFLNLLTFISIIDSSGRNNLTLAETIPTVVPLESPSNDPNSSSEIEPKQPSNLTPENPQPEIVPTPPTETQPNLNNAPESTLFIIGLNVGYRNVNSGVLVRGKVTDTEAIDFENWLIPYDEVLKALKFTSKVISENEVELRSPFKVTRINLNQVRNDPELGLVLSIQDIQEILGIEAKFDPREYAVVFDVPETNNNFRNQQAQQPVIVEGLPRIVPPHFTWSQIEQRINVNGRDNSDTTTQGDLSAVGTVFGSSWFMRVSQPDFNDNQTWRLSELQIARQRDKNDYYLGSQQRFWGSFRGGDLWGLTMIQRQGFSPFSVYGGGVPSPTLRLRPDQVTTTVTGNAQPGTLVRLVRNLYSGEIIAEQLVDASGIYRFNNVPIGLQAGRNYQVLLYPNGMITAQPQIENVRFTVVPQQLPVGTSARIVSLGWQRQLNNNDFLGEFTEFNTAITQRWGVTQDLTVGLGAVYASSVNSLAEIFYQPKNSPLGVSVSGLIGDNLGINTDLIWDNYPNLYARVSSNFDSKDNDFNSTDYTLDAQILPRLRFVINGNFERGTDLGLQYSASGRNFTTLARVGMDTDGEFVWYLYQNLGKFYLTHRQNNTSTFSELFYLFNPYQSVVLDYQTDNSTDKENLLTAYWSYRSPARTRYGEYRWQADLGVLTGSQGSGLYAMAGTSILPGVSLQARYRGVSLTSNEGSFNIQLVPNFNLQQGISAGNRQLERLRTEGGLLVKPFYDRNSNGKQDAKEEIYTDSSEFLIVNNQVIPPGQLDINRGKLFLRLPPDTYRVDLDPAGFPPDFQPSVNAFAVAVVEGSFTPLLIALQPSYTVGGVVTDAKGKPLPGARVEGISTESQSSVISITNGAGVYYLEQLRQGTYQLKVNGKPVEPNTITINAQSETLQELNIKLP